MTNSYYMVVGDIHGYWADINSLIAEQKPDIVLSVGDFGYWPGNQWYDPKQLKPQGAKIYWCEGNHEHLDKLAERESNEIAPNVIYQPRGSNLTLPDGRTVFFCGGAESVDKETRTMGIDWFPEEIPNYAEAEKILDAAEKLGHVDIMISHTCPVEFNVGSKDDGRFNDPTRKLLSRLLEMLRPDLWYFGHWHNRKDGRESGRDGTCCWMALNMAKEPGWWTWLR